MFTIGNVVMKNPVVSAPLAGVSDKAFRIMARSFGCGLIFTEMISDMGLIYGQARTGRMVDLSGEDDPVAVQIFGSQVEPLVKAAAIVEKTGCSIIDINMGCPTPKIVKNGEGAALMLDIPKCRAIIRSVTAAVKVPVTIKMRKGWDEDNISYLELAEVAEEEGAQAVTLHPRTRAQFFSGTADWEAIKQLKRHIAIPVIGNGDIWKAADALRMMEYTGCDAVMIGRSALGNPFIYRQTANLLAEGTSGPISQEERLRAARRHLELVCMYKGEETGIREMRKHLAWYTRGMRGAAKIREEINHCQTRDEMLSILERLTAADERVI